MNIKKIKKRIIDSLKEKIIPNGKPGLIDKTKYPGPNSKIRRHEGRVYPRIFNPKMKWKDIHQEALEPDYYWDDWIDYRDGLRMYSWRFCNCEKCALLRNKIIKNINIRKARRHHFAGYFL